MKKLLKKLLPQKAISFYHYSIALIAAMYYGFPSQKMVVIGVTGTKGKTSASNFIWACLEAGGYKTGIISTANIRIGAEETMNYLHMTMPGRLVIQKLMAKMVRAGCRYCIVETTSEGLKQYRHIGINYDMAVFTNLTPEHLPSHGGSFEAYQRAKGTLFAALDRLPRKKISNAVIPKTIIANYDSEHHDYFLHFPADKKIVFGLHSGADCRATDVHGDAHGVTFKVNSKVFALGILGAFNVYNALPAIVIARLANIGDNAIARGLKNLTLIPGRMELINEGQPFTVIVDYAHEKQSITHVLNTGNDMRMGDSKIIILLGAEGGGRDKAKRPIMGELSAKMADYIIVSNVDPYEDDPKEIVEDIATVAEKFGKIRDANLFVIEDRRAGIAKALSLAKPHDVVIITGKGAEQSMIIGGASIPWDDRVVVREELKKIVV